MSHRPAAAYKMLAVLTQRLLEAPTDDAQLTLRKTMLKLALHFSGLNETQMFRAHIRCQHPFVFSAAETYALDLLAVIAEVKRGG